MASWKEFLIKIGIEADGKPLEGIEKRLEGISHALEFLAAAEVVKGLYEITERFAKFGEELHVASVAAGMSTEAFQRLALAAGQSSISQEEMSMSMSRLNRQLYQARLGGAQAVSAFQQAGIRPDQLSGIKNGGDAMLLLADRFKNMTDATQKSALATQLFGRGSYQMVAFLSQGSAKIKSLGAEFAAFGGTLTNEQVEALGSAEHSFNKLAAVMRGFGGMVASYLAPILNSLVGHFLKFYAANKKIIESNVKEWAGDLAFALGFLYALAEDVTQRFINFADAHRVLVRRVGEVIGALMLLTFGLGALKSAIFAIKIVTDLWSGAINLLPLNFLKNMLAKVALALTETSAAGWLVNAAFAVMEAGPLAIAAAVTVLALALQGLWTWMSGGKFEDTWFSKLISAGGKGLSWVMDKAGSLMGVGIPGASVPGMGGAMQAFGNMQSVSQMAANPSVAVPGISASQAANNSSNYVDNSQYNLSVQLPPGAHEKATTDAVNGLIKKAHDEKVRKVQQSVRPTVNR